MSDSTKQASDIHLPMSPPNYNIAYCGAVGLTMPMSDDIAWVTCRACLRLLGTDKAVQRLEALKL